MKRLPYQQLNRDVRRERDAHALRRQWLWLACGLLLVGGFVMAARQQVAAVQYGYQSEELRREREFLVREQRRLLLELEESSSPARLEQAARAMGLEPTRPAQIEAAGGGAAVPAPAVMASAGRVAARVPAETLRRR